ncbi:MULTISPECIES: type II secretion system protein N [unclassified Pseudomonas]|uniref:type II secretion system protein N n=1 Tax=unclassified Pseudomonas TaxID=196821 RepID=UPI002958B553|nr:MULTISPECIES: type II secretion system protein N [unclassified Pseudomonas]
MSTELKMKVSNFSVQRFRACLSSVCWLALPVGGAVFLAWQEKEFREHLASPSSDIATLVTVPVREPLETASIAIVFGLTTETTPQPSAEPLTLQASFVSNGLSKALLANAQGSRLYQVGERLPGGSVLRRIETHQVALWNKGREELLTLVPSGARFLKGLESSVDSQPVNTTTRFLRPLSGQPE